MKFLEVLVLAGSAVAMVQNQQLKEAKSKLDATLEELYNTHAAGHVDGVKEASDQITAIFATGQGTVEERKDQVFDVIEQGLKKYNVDFSFDKANAPNFLILMITFIFE